MQATGGIVTIDGDYTVHTFLEDGTLEVIEAGVAEVLLVAGGGGGGGGNRATGAGAGGVLQDAARALTVGSKPVIVGTGGPRSGWRTDSVTNPASQGENSTFDGLVAIGGGFGTAGIIEPTEGPGSGGAFGGVGGSGGAPAYPGFGGNGTAGGVRTLGTPGQGNDSGISFNGGPYYGTGGGGGAGGVGGHGTNVRGGAGGVGILSAIRGVPTLVAHSHWRIRVDAWDAVFYAAFGEVQFRAALGGPNVAVGGTPSADTEYPGYAVAGAFDGSDASQWSADGFNVPHWIAYEFAAPTIINEVLLRSFNRTEGGGLIGFTVQSSDDGMAWTDEWAVYGIASWPAFTSRVYSRTIARGYGGGGSGDCYGAFFQYSGTASHGGGSGHNSDATQDGRANGVPGTGGGGGANGNGGSGILVVRYLTPIVVGPSGWVETDLDPSSAWVETDLDPNVDSVPDEIVVGVGPGVILGLVAGNQYSDVIYTYGGIEVRFEKYVLGPGYAGTPFQGSFQFAPGTGGVEILAPYSVYLDEPVRGVRCTLMQGQFQDNRIELYDEDDVLVGTIAYTPIVVPLIDYVGEVDLGDTMQVIRRLKFIPDTSDWVCWKDLILLANSDSGRGWQETDAAPANTWGQADG